MRYCRLRDGELRCAYVEPKEPSASDFRGQHPARILSSGEVKVFTSFHSVASSKVEALLSDSDALIECCLESGGSITL
jgi:hypothetical protein